MRPQELNMLVIFDAIMTERSITRAADRLALTQPAVSNALSKMRVIWKDELFVKDGRNIQPTIYAQNLWSNVHEPLNIITEALSNQTFDPATANRTFRVAVVDVAVDMAWVPLRQMIEKEAPGINIHAIPYTIVNTEEVLDGGKVDILVGGSTGNNPSFVQEFMFNLTYVCVMRKGHPLAQGRLTIKKFAAADHLFVSLSGDTVGYSDQALAQQGLKRRIACTVNHMSAVAPLLQSTDLICVLPAEALEQAAINDELHVAWPPFELSPDPIFLVWHRRQNRDIGLTWFKKILKDLITTETTRKHNAVCEKIRDCKRSAT